MPDFSEIESLFGLLLNLGSTFSESERTEVREFIDVGEYGLALDTAVSIFEEEGKVASEDERLVLRRLAVAMSRAPELLLERLPK